VTVTDGGWDTHANNFKSLKDSRIPPVDQALPRLLIDLEERGMLDSTLVCWLTDFGRTPKINSASGRDHWATAGFAVMAGAAPAFPEAMCWAPPTRKGAKWSATRTTATISPPRSTTSWAFRST
jgi:hypothetical protein